MPNIKIEAVSNKLAKNGTTKLCSIKTIDRNGQEVWISGFGNSTTESWRKGQTVELEVYQEEYNGKLSWKFQEPAEKNIFEEIARLESKIDELIKYTTQPLKPSQNSNSGNLDHNDAPPAGTTREEYPVGEEMVNLEDIPF